MKNNLFGKTVRYFLPFWKAILFITIFIAAQGTISSFIPYLSKPLIDSGYANRDIKIVIILAVIGGAMFIVTTLIGFIQKYATEKVKRNLTLKLGEDYSDSLYNLSLESFRVKSAGERAYLLTADLDSISNFFTSRLPQAFGLFLKVLLYFAISFTLNKGFSCLLFVFTPFLIFISRTFAKVNKKNYIELMRQAQIMNQKIYESFSKIYLIKSFGTEGYEKKRYMDLLRERLSIKLKSLRFGFLSSLAGNLFNKIATGAVSVLGIFLVIKKTMTLGDLSAFLVYYGLFLGAVSQALSFFEQIPMDKIHLKNFFGLIESKSRIEDAPGAKQIGHLTGAIKFCDVKFGYEQEKAVLDNFNFEIIPGVWNAIIGPSGCGKTTVLNLLMRLYNVDSGQILIDGYNIRELKIESLRKNITISTQDVLFFTDTIRNNVFYGLDITKAKESDLADVLELACIDVFIKELPNGYETILGDNAFNLSQGQKQRLAIARALVRKPGILILDEALSAVDIDTEAKIYNNIRSFRKRLTTIMVSHRPATIRQADVVHRMDFGGKIEEIRCIKNS